MLCEEKFQELLEIAEKVSCEVAAQKGYDAVKKLMAQEHLNVVVTGVANSGKSTYINRLVGIEVAEESMISDDQELPLRVSFEAMDNDPSYRCVTVVNNRWYEASALLYEMHERDILQNDVLSAEMRDKDVVFFLISATAPFNTSEISLLKKLAPLSRQVVLGGMDYIPESSREKIVDYVKKINDSMGLPPLLVFENSPEQDIGRIVRNLLPAYQELQTLRETHAESIFRQTVDETIQLMKSAKQDNANQLEVLIAKRQQLDSVAKGMQTAWDSLLTETKRRMGNAANAITETLPSEGKMLIQRIIEDGRRKSFSGEWLNMIQTTISENTNSSFERRIAILKEQYLRDLMKVSNDAAYMRLDGYKEADFVRLKGSDLGNHRIKITAGDFGKEMQTMPRNSSGRMKILLGTGVALGAVALSPLPQLAKAIGGTAVIVGSASRAMKQHTDECEAEVKKVLGKWYPQYISAMDESLREVAEQCYEGLITHLNRCRDGVRPQDVDAAPAHERGELLDKYIAVCESML